MNYQRELEAYFQDKGPALAEAACRLCAIPSVKGESAPGAPFGPQVARCLEEALSLAAELGLCGQNYDGYVGAVDLNAEETALHILCHLDVVDPGEGWTVTEPFRPVLRDGQLYGRGTADDKGPAAAVLLAMQAVKELGIPLRHNVRLILGTDEESGSADLAWYYAREPYAPCAFTPDSDFPVTHIEKGGYKPVFSRAWAPSEALPQVRELHGGVRLNILPGDAWALAAGLTAGEAAPLVDRAAEQTGVRFQLEDTPDGLRISARGTGSHAAEPKAGNNAITALLELLCMLPLAECGSTRALRALHALFPHGDTAGQALGIAQEDALSGPLTLAFSLLELNEAGLEGRFDARTPLCATQENCRLAAEAAFGRFGFTCAGEMTPPHHTPEETPFVRTLLQCYEAYTGAPGRCLATGGTTYVHNIPSGVAFGPCMPGVQTNMHGPDEHACLADLLTAAKVYAQAIVEICGTAK